MNINPEETFIRQSVAYARTLAVPHSVLYLRGMLNLIGDSDLLHTVRSAFLELSHCDSQLELISSGQMTLLPEGESPSSIDQNEPTTPPSDNGPQVGI